MPRYARQEAPGAVQHVISRVINGEFRISDFERDDYLRRVPRVLEGLELEILMLAYCLMSNHTHWAMLMQQFTSARFIHPLHTGFAEWMNRVQGRFGPVFAERHTSRESRDESIAGLLAYIHNNPVRAGVVTDPADSTWTSHRAYIGEVQAPPWLDVERGLAAAGFSSSPSGRLAFHDFVRSVSGDKRDPSLSAGDPARVRAAARAAAGGPVEVMSPVEKPGGRTALAIRAIRDTSFHRRWPGEPTRVAALVARAAGLSIEDLRSRDRSHAVTSARRLLLLAWTEFLGRQQQEMSAYLGLSVPGGSNLLRRNRRLTASLHPEAKLIAQICWDEVGEKAE